VQNLTTLASAIPEISLGAPEFKMGHVTLTTPLLRVISRTNAATWYSLCTKFDHSIFSRYGDWCSPKFKRCTWPDHAHFTDDLSSVG